MVISQELRQKLDRIPHRPGVYLMKDRGGRILYVGKAKRLDHRLRSHFSPPFDHPKQRALVQKVADLDVIATDSEVDALILEMTLIKEKRPPYNINLKDDKRFPFVKVTIQEEFPRIVLTRRVKDDGARYFGPWTDVGNLRRTLRSLRTIFPIRSCKGTRPGIGPRHRECLDYHIHRCLAPCIKPEVAGEYRRAAEAFCLFLSGGADPLIARLRGEMEAAAAGLEYEVASSRRDQIRMIERLAGRQRMVDVQKRDTDLFAITRDGDLAWGVILQVRDGRVLGKERRTLRGVTDSSDAEVMSALVSRYYDGADQFPSQVALAVEPADRLLLEEWLALRKGSAVTIVVPQRGNLAHLVRLARSNARLDMEEGRGLKGGKEIAPAVYELQGVLGLDGPPVRIDAFDISNFQGTNPVASLVVMINGVPSRGNYRRYRMQAPGPDDFAMMHEVVLRRVRRVVAGEFPPPDLVLIDGGIGQVGAAQRALAEGGLPGLPVIGLAKREEEIIVPGASESIRLPRSHPALRLLMQLRDEAHRFAVTYHRNRRGKAALASQLDTIPGIGPERRIRLLRHFGSFEAIRAASEDDLAHVPGFGPTTARKIHAALQAHDGGVAA